MASPFHFYADQVDKAKKQALFQSIELIKKGHKWERSHFEDEILRRKLTYPLKIDGWKMKFLGGSHQKKTPSILRQPEGIAN